MTEQEFRIEHDTMGEVKVPVNARRGKLSHLRPRP